MNGLSLTNWEMLSRPKQAQSPSRNLDLGSEKGTFFFFFFCITWDVLFCLKIRARLEPRFKPNFQTINSNFLEKTVYLKVGKKKKKKVWKAGLNLGSKQRTSERAYGISWSCAHSKQTPFTWAHCWSLPLLLRVLRSFIREELLLHIPLPPIFCLLHRRSWICRHICP